MISLKSGPPNAEANDASPFDQSMALVSDWVDDVAPQVPPGTVVRDIFPSRGRLRYLTPLDFVGIGIVAVRLPSLNFGLRIQIFF
ncbi:hypothetical protein GBA52_005768 [Prunus armeniaca]|nr:hypothetical protein GBA52_005768 [Prunus armeniaca]